MFIVRFFIILFFIISCSSENENGANPGGGGGSSDSSSLNTSQAPLIENKLLYDDSDEDGIGVGPGVLMTVKNSVIPKKFSATKFNGNDDNCPDVYNPDQSDSLKSGLGDACDPTYKSNTTLTDQCGFGQTFTSIPNEQSIEDPEIGTATTQYLKILTASTREIDATTIARDPGLKNSIKYLLQPGGSTLSNLTLVQVLRNNQSLPLCELNQSIHQVNINQCFPQRSTKIELRTFLTMKDIDVTATSSLYFDPLKGIFIWAPSSTQYGLYTFYFSGEDANQNTVHQTLKVCVKKPPTCTGTGEFCKFINKLPVSGPNKPAGNQGDWYNNCDNFHTNLPNWQTEHVEVNRIKSLCWGSNETLIKDKVVIGNSSTSNSIPCTSNRCQYGLNQSGKFAINNHYWFPEHRDHDANDYFPTNFLYASASQGSSGTEMDEVSRFFKILASFKTSTKEALIKSNLVIPTVMMVDRCTRFNSASTCKNPIPNSGHPYLKGISHPSVFDDLNSTLIHYVRNYYEEEFKDYSDDDINNAILRVSGSPKTLQDRLSVLLTELSLEAYKMAYSMEPEDIAPTVELEILYETPFENSLATIVTTSKHTIGRIRRDSVTNPLEFVIRAKARGQPGKTGQFFWEKLREDPSFKEAIIISTPDCTSGNYCTPSTDCKIEEGCHSSTMRIQFKTPRPFVLNQFISAKAINQPLNTKRYDIGVFFHNGSTYSAPSFITLSGTW